MGGGIVTALFINVQDSVSSGGLHPKVGLWGSAGICFGACVIILVIWFFTLRPKFADIRKAHLLQMAAEGDAAAAATETDAAGGGEGDDEALLSLNADKYEDEEA
jgi:hypothetical protein